MNRVFLSCNWLVVICLLGGLARIIAYVNNVSPYNNFLFIQNLDFSRSDTSRLYLVVGRWDHDALLQGLKQCSQIWLLKTELAAGSIDPLAALERDIPCDREELVLRFRGDLAYELGKHRAAVANYRGLPVNRLLRYGQIELNHGDAQKGLFLIELALGLDGLRPAARLSAYQTLADYHRRAGDYDVARAYYEWLLEQRPADLSNRYLLALVYRNSGLPEQAVAVLEPYREALETARPSLRYYYLVELGKNYQGLGRWAEARAAWEAAKSVAENMRTGSPALLAAEVERLLQMLPVGEE